MDSVKIEAEQGNISTNHCPGFSGTKTEIRVLERLDDHRSGWFDDLAVLTHEDGSTSLVGQLVDQSALFGVLEKINRLGLTLISIVQLPES